MAISVNQYLKQFQSYLTQKNPPKDKIIESFGLDIGSYSVKVVHLKRNNKWFNLVNYATARIKNGNTAETIKQLLDTTGINTASVNIGLSGQGVIIRYVTLPKMPQKELTQSISTEVDKYIPFPIEDVILDCHILQELERRNKIYVLVAAAKKELIDERMKLLSALNLEPGIIDIDSIAIVNAFNELLPNTDTVQTGSGARKAQAIAMLNIGASLSCLNILEDNILQLSRDIYIGGNDFSKRIGYKLNFEFEKAEEMKKNPTDEQSEKHLEACELVLNNLMHELRISFDYYETENNIQVKKIFLSGGSAYFKGLDNLISKTLGVEAQVWDPSLHLEIDPKIDAASFKAQSSKLAVALGLALR